MSSPNKSTLDNSFKLKKPDVNYSIVDLKDGEKFITEYMVKHKKIKREEYKKTWKKVLETKDGEILINNENDEIIGWVHVKKKSKEICPLYVVKKYRGYGFSNILFKDAVKKYGGTWLVVYEDNEVAINLYKKNGFVISDRKPRHYDEGDMYYMHLANHKPHMESVIIDKFNKGKLSDDKLITLLNYINKKS